MSSFPLVLFVDNEPDRIREDPVWERLSAVQLQGEVVTGLTDALQFVEQHRDRLVLVFMDLIWSSPRADEGINYIRELKREYPRMPVILFTGRAKELRNDIAQVFDAGADSILFKRLAPERAELALRFIKRQYIDACPLRDRCQVRDAERRLLRDFRRETTVFLATPYTEDTFMNRIRAVVQEVGRDAGLHVYEARDKFSGFESVRPHVEACLHASSRMVAVLHDPRRGGGTIQANLDVLVEVGAAAALGLPIFLVRHADLDLPHFLKGRVEPAIMPDKEEDLDILRQALQRWLER